MADGKSLEDLKDVMQGTVPAADGTATGDTRVSFRNNSQIHTPANDAEVKSILQSAMEAGERVKVVGGGHSWSTIARPEGGWFVSMDKMNSE